MKYEGKRGEIESALLDIISTVAPDEDLSDINYQQKLRDQLDIDSMDFLDIVMELRKRHRIEVPKEDYPNLATLDSCLDYLAQRFPEDFKYTPK